MNIEYDLALKFMFSQNKQARAFLLKEFITIRNGFENEGLIAYHFNCDYEGYDMLEKLYFKALKRNIEHRILTFYLNFSKKSWDIKNFNKVLSFIKANKQHIKFQFKVKTLSLSFKDELETEYE
jgi:hypothetical protein